MRQRYIVTYDIADPGRLRKVFKLMKGYGEHLQFSVFRCDLSKMTLATMKAELNELIHAQEDQVLIIEGKVSEDGFLTMFLSGRRRPP